MKRSVATPFALLLTLCLATSGGAVAAPMMPANAPAPAALTGPQVGAPAPDFSLTTVDGKTVSLNQFHGKTLVLNVWATWCPPCRQEMPDLISRSKVLMKTGVAFLGVDTSEEAPIVRAYVAAKGVPYPQAIDTSKAFEKLYDVQGFPSTYVIDGQGVLRARYVDVIGPVQLDTLVAAANAGKNGVITSPLQRKIDAALTPGSFTYTGSDKAIIANATSVNAAIAKAEDLMDQSDAASGNATDFLRTRTEEAAIRDAAIASLAPVQTSGADAALLPTLRGDAARDREDWQPAIDAYAAALAIDPKSDDALSGTAMAAGQLKQRALVVDADTKLAALEPTDSGDLIDLGRAQYAAGNLADAVATFQKGVAVAQARVDAHPKDPKAIRALAAVHLYFGRTYAKDGDTPHAREQFNQLLVLATQLPLKDSRHDMYLEEGQEALVALTLTDTQRGAMVSLVPWTGADLPGSIPNTIKYRLVVAGRAGNTVALTTADVPKGWVASFCSDRVCAPFRVSVAIPDSGVKVVEFQLVPPSGKGGAPKVRVIGNDGSHSSTATT